MPRRPSNDTSIGDRIRHRRQLRGWTIRHAASRAGLNPSTWSRIERGLRSADNRFMLAEIATALECSVAELAGIPAASGDRHVAAAIAGVVPVREALIDVDLHEGPTCTAQSVDQIRKTALIEADLRLRCDYAGALRLLPDLLRQLHAATHGPDRDPALRMLVRAAHDAFICLSSVGYVAEGWLAARLAHQAAQELGDPVLRGFADYTMSRSAVSAGSYSRALRLADRGADELEPSGADGAVEMLGMLRLAGAYASRALRQPADDRLAEAEVLAERTGETDLHGLYFGPTNVRIWQVSMDVDGGDPERAVAVARTTTPSLVQATCRRSLFYIDLGRGLSHLRRTQEATRMLLIGERLAPQRVRASRYVAETVRSLGDQAVSPELQGLAERVGVAS